MSEEKKQCDSKTCDKESCAGCSHAKGNGVPKENLNALSKITKVIGVVSGKGGVGKSMVTASLANEMAYHGYRVGIMDADITGPSIPRMYGLKGSAVADDNGIYPVITDNDIKVMSINLLMPDPETPIIWRGPVIANMIKQFWTDVIWGELDFLLVDMPPGTGDVPLTVFQSLPVDGIMVVSTPQDLVKMIVKKAYNMAQQMHIPVLSLIENFSYLVCPDCGKEIPVFGKSKIDEISDELDVLVGGKIPIDPKLVELADAGEFAKAEIPYLDTAYQTMMLLKLTEDAKYK